MLMFKCGPKFEVTVTYSETDEPSEKIIRIRDVTKRKKQTEELKYMAYYDSLTGLYNRNYFVRILSEWVRKAQTEKATIDVLCIRMDDFKRINDSMGMIAGDEILQAFGLFLRDLQSEDIIVSHFNDDIYYLAIYNPYGNHNVDAVYRKIGNAVCSGLFFLRLYDFRTIDDLQRISGRFRIIGNTDTDCDFLFNVSHHLKRLFRSLAYFPVLSAAI